MQRPLALAQVSRKQQTHRGMHFAPDKNMQTTFGSYFHQFLVLTLGTTLTFTHLNAGDEKLFYSITAIDTAGYESALSEQVPYQLFLPTIAKD
ncbi:MAG: hypothetical protein R2932_55950 [Caldilineaceae bacterium]